MSIKVDLLHSSVDSSLVGKLRDAARKKYALLWDGLNHSDEEDLSWAYTGWLDYPNQITEEYLQRIEGIAKEIKVKSDILLVIGTGGSYMGTRAITELLPTATKTELLFLGFDFNERHLREVFNTIADRDFSLCVVSKSGSTMETMVAFSLALDKMKERYGEEESLSRIYVITEDKPNPLNKYAQECGSHIIYIPENIGGRYSIFTAVGLLPLAVHGIDIREFVAGGRSLANRNAFDGDGLDYAITRLLLGGYLQNDSQYGAPTKDENDSQDSAPTKDENGSSQVPENQNRCQKTQYKCLEIFEVYDSYAEYFCNWLKQLFGESEGKDGKGIYPTQLLFNRDLHSIGQFLQDGSKVFFETMLFMGDSYASGEMVIPDNPLVSNIAGKRLVEVRRSVEEGVIKAHAEGGVPLISLRIDQITPRNLGELMYFFMVQSAVSALLLDVNPFDQPGVEKYKAEVIRLLK